MKKKAWQIEFKDRFLNNEKKESPIITALLYFIIVFLCFLLVFIFFFQLCYIDGNSMNNTLYNSEHVLLVKGNNDIKVGDIIVITKNKDTNNSYNIIKRVIALPGDSIKFEYTSGNIIQLLRKRVGENEFSIVSEPYIAEPMIDLMGWVTAKPNSKKPYIVGEGNIFVMGDNRNHSEDSRGKDGTYKIQNIYGKMCFRIKKDTIIEFLLKILYQETSPTK